MLCSDNKKRRDRELYHTARLKQAGIDLEDDEGEEAVSLPGQSGEYEEEYRKLMAQRKQRGGSSAVAAAARGSGRGGAAGTKSSKDEKAPRDAPRWLQKKDEFETEGFKMDGFWNEGGSYEEGKQADAAPEDAWYAEIEQQQKLKEQDEIKRATATDGKTDDTKSDSKSESESTAAAAAAAAAAPSKPLTASELAFQAAQNKKLAKAKVASGGGAGAAKSSEMDDLSARYVIVKHLKPGETVLKAIKRLGQTLKTTPGSNNKPKAKPKPSRGPKKSWETDDSDEASTAVVSEEESAAQRKRDKLALEELTEAADTLMQNGFLSMNQTELFHCLSAIRLNE